MPSRVQSSIRSQPSPTVFGIARRETDGRTSVISVEGELDLASAPRLKWMLVDQLETGHGRLVVDLSDVTFMDSTALGVLVGVKRRLGEGERLAIVCRRSEVLTIFEFAGMDGMFAIFPTLEDALAHAQGLGARAD
jgi:anti-sigma B factor antagonist